ncbi:hypothetical protein HS041_15005 [Planomonospora sp. ID67723]|uniref:hypothetical protein n=1 Tax=Planomonospora sp. ID67723 TaxID=2738134 RepID=UPI0018C365E0|nr:hypothetical protein [Planomonospora sp. ID67723]MBG0829079.1 hypothetical protein [Planomonospora sp. ID67723]
MVTDGRRRGGRSPVFGTVLTLLAAFLLHLTVPNIGMTVRAARADGIAGGFTPQRMECVQHPGHESCTWTGEFRSGDGTVHRQQIEMYGADRYSLRPGERVAAVDIGHPSRVYGPGGSNEWVFTALVLLVALTMLTFVYGGPLRRAFGLGKPASRARAGGSVPAKPL